MVSNSGEIRRCYICRQGIKGNVAVKYDGTGVVHRICFSFLQGDALEKDDVKKIIDYYLASKKVYGVFSDELEQLFIKWNQCQVCKQPAKTGKIETEEGIFHAACLSFLHGEQITESQLGGILKRYTISKRVHKYYDNNLEKLLIEWNNTHERSNRIL